MTKQPAHWKTLPRKSYRSASSKSSQVLAILRKSGLSGNGPGITATQIYLFFTRHQTRPFLCLRFIQLMQLFFFMACKLSHQKINVKRKDLCKFPLTNEICYVMLPPQDGNDPEDRIGNSGGIDGNRPSNDG